MWLFYEISLTPPLSRADGKSHTTTVTVTSSAPLATASNGLIEDYAAMPVGQLETVALDCPAVNKQRYTTTYNPAVPPKNFNIVCGRSLWLNTDPGYTA